MGLGDYLEGLVFFACTWGGASYVAFAIERRRLPRLDFPPRAMALGMLFLSTLIAVHLAPGVLGLLSPAAAAVTAALAAGAASRIPASSAARLPSASPPARADALVSWVLAAAAVLGLAAFTLTALSSVRLEPPSHVDAMSFALPGVVEWIRSGSIWEAGSFLPLLQVRTYPNNGEVLTLAAMLPWNDDAFLRLVPLPLLAMTAIGVMGIGRELGASTATATVLGAAAVAPKVISGSALYDLKPDVFMYATFAGGVLFLLRHARTGARADLLLAGLGLGLAFGSRWYAMPVVAVVLAVWLGCSLVARRKLPRPFADGAIVAALVLAAGGFWLLRNLALTGNPLYPVRLDPLGVTLLDAPKDVITEEFGFSVLDRLGQPGFLVDELGGALAGALHLPGALVIAGMALAVAMLLRGGRSQPGARTGAVLLAAGLLAAVYLVLPAGAQGLPGEAVPGIVEQNVRWLVPGFLLCAAATAVAVSALPARFLVVCQGVVVLCALAAARAAYPVSAARLAVSALGVGVVAAAVRWTVLRPRSPRPHGHPFGRRAAAATLAGVVVALAVAGYLHQEDYDEARFDGRSAVVDWVTDRAQAGANIGVAGHWPAGAFVPTYALFGPRLENDVEYVGPEVDDQVRLYQDPRAFRSALTRNNYEFLAVGRLEEPDFMTLRRQRLLTLPPEARWARSVGFTEVTRDGAFVLLARRAR